MPPASQNGTARVASTFVEALNFREAMKQSSANQQRRSHDAMSTVCQDYSSLRPGEQVRAH